MGKGEGAIPETGHINSWASAAMGLPSPCDCGMAVERFRLIVAKSETACLMDSNR